MAAAPELDKDFQALVRRRYAGNPQAMTALGARLIVGREAPCAPFDGAALIAEAAQQGDAEAWSYTAVLAAAGIGREQSWTDAFDALHRASQLGDAKAVRQAQLLQEMELGATSDIPRWLSSVTGRNVYEAPRLVAYGSFLSPGVCAYLTERAAPRLVRAQVNDFYTGKLKTDAMRTNTGAAFSLIDTDLVIQLVRARIAHAAAVDAQHLEPLEILHYAVGQRLKPHLDFYHPNLPNYDELVRVKGQRTKTCLLYLNDDYEGGETDFPKIGLMFRGRTGEALIFDNVLADGSGDMNTLHEGLPPTRGEKWLLSQWLRDKPQPVA